MAMRVLIPVGLFALALAVRSLSWPQVFQGGRVVFFGMDAWYHMRRVAIALSGNGWPPSFDPYLNFPHGAMPIWPPYFDALLAWAVWPAAALGGFGAAEAAAAWLPPLVGALTVVVGYRVAADLFDSRVAALAGLGLALLSAHAWYSQLGFVDHHFAVAFVTTLLLGSAVSSLRGLTGPDPGRAWRSAAGTGAVCASCLLVWPGTLLHVGIVVAVLGLAGLTRPTAREAAAASRVLGVAALVALAITGPAGALSGWEGSRAFSPTVLSGFQPLLFGSLALLAASCVLVFTRSPDTGPVRRGLLALCLALGIALLALLALPQLTTGLDEAWRWFTKDELFQGMVRESKPLFVGEDGFRVDRAELRLSRFVYVLPLALAALAFRAAAEERGPERAVLWLLLTWTLALAGATLLQRRFFNSLSPAFAIVSAWAVVASWREVSRRFAHGSHGRRRAAQAGVALLAAILFAPTLAAYGTPLENLVASARGERLTVPRAQLSRRIMFAVANWIRRNTEPTSGPFDPNAKPEYGVLAHWGWGHLIKYEALRPSVVGNFGDDVGGENLIAARAYFASPEPEAVEILERLRVRYVIATSPGEVSPEWLEGGAMMQRLLRDDSPGLAHHRLLYETPIDSHRAEIGHSEFRVFERVAGARVVGEAPPGAVVRASLPYTSNRGRRGRALAGARADEQGRYEIRLPYATRGAPPGVDTAAAWVVQSGDRAVPVPISEAEVQSGSLVEGPSFR